ncbi:MAG: ISAzo13 family transposase [Methanoregula sp.]
MHMESSIKARYDSIKDHLNEKSQRLWLGNEALALGRGGISYVSKQTGVTRNTISKGYEEVQQLPQQIITGDRNRIRKDGGGRKTKISQDKTLISDLYTCIEPFIRGDPESPLLWTTKSLRLISDELAEKGHTISYRSVGTMLSELGFSLQSNRKTHDGESHEDRNAQFLHIYNRCNEFMQENQPVISVDAKKKELIGNLKNNGKTWRQKNDPVKVNVYDFPSLYEKAIPYGIFDLGNNQGWIHIGIDRDTAEFSVESIRQWWKFSGSRLYPHAKKLLITADCGGSNGYRNRLWKRELQKLSTEEKIAISVCHLPPGTSKWNKIEHRLFSCMSITWRGQPLRSYQIMINLIKSTKTKTGLSVDALLDDNTYPKGIKISDAGMEMINLIRDPFHGEWNYTVMPQNI